MSNREKRFWAAIGIAWLVLLALAYLRSVQILNI